MLEKLVEQKLVRGVRKLGGKAYKFVSPGNVGVPDRIVIWPDGTVQFVELKTTRGRLSQLQDVQCKKLLSLLQPVYILYGPEAVKDYLTNEGGIHGESSV